MSYKSKSKCRGGAGINDKDLPLDQSYEPTISNMLTPTSLSPIATMMKVEPCCWYCWFKSYGVAKKAKLVSVKVLSCSGGGTRSGVTAAVHWVKDKMHVHIPLQVNSLRLLSV